MYDELAVRLELCFVQKKPEDGSPRPPLTKSQSEATSRRSVGLMTGVCGDPWTASRVGMGCTPQHFWAAQTVAQEPAGVVSPLGDPK